MEAAESWARKQLRSYSLPSHGSDTARVPPRLETQVAPRPATDAAAGSSDHLARCPRLKPKTHLPTLPPLHQQLMQPLHLPKTTTALQLRPQA